MTRQVRRLASAALATGVLCGTLGAGLGAVPAAAAAHGRAALPVTIRVLQLSPTTPEPTQGKAPFTVQLALTNTSSHPLTHVEVQAQRGDPLGSQRELDLSLADTSTHASGLPIEPTKPVITDIPADGTVSVTFPTTTSLNSGAGICLCADAVYPLDLSAHQTVSGADTVVGATRTYVPSFDVAPAKQSVSWVWPLLDRPHRLADGTVFTDDALTDSVSGGRLDRSLQVLEQVAGKVPMTVVLDPELIDELTVMATGRYTVREPGGHTVPGVGQQAAESWLARLHTLVTENPTSIQIELTPYADPDVQSLSERHLPWASTMPTSMAVHVSQALGDGNVDATLAWVPGGRLDTRTLTALSRTGVDSVLLDSRATSPSTQNYVPLSLATVRADRRSERLVLTSPALQADVAASLTQGAVDTSRLPLLVSELAARVAQSPNSPQAVVLTPPRYVNPSPDLAVRTIEATVDTPFSKSAALSAILHATSFPSPSVRLRAVPATTSGLSTAQLDRAVMVHSVLPAVSTMLSHSIAGQTFSGQLPHALQRIESAAWRTDATPGDARLGGAFSAQLSGQVNSVLSGVQIVKPSTGSYTLAGSNSPVPITVRNDLPYPVAVDVTVTTVGNLPGLTVHQLPVQIIPASSKQTLRIPTSVQRSGRIPVSALLRAPNDYPLGHPVTLFIHSTVLGTIGIVITVAAGVVLLLALLIRYLRRIRRLRDRRRRGLPPTRRVRPNVPTREPVT